MEKYDAIIKCINDTLKDKESSLNYYREEMPKRDARIRELEVKVAQLEGENKGLLDSLEYSVNLNGELGNSNEALKDEIVTLKKVIESLKAEVNNLANF
jgi:chromosome segregation ATPase